nr:MAG TPA: hypothetical protein [Siphoviridae sp. ctcBx5]
MEKLKIYILGMVTALVALPIIDEVVEIICSFLEILKGISTKKVLKINKDIMDLQEQLEPINTNCIDFEAPNTQYYDDWEDNKVKNKIGFR